MFFPQVAVPPIIKGKFKVLVLGFPLGYFTATKIPRGKPKSTSVHPAGLAAPVKFPTGQIEYEDLELKGYQGTDGLLDAAITTWVKQCADARTGVATLPPQAAKRDIVVIEYDTNGVEIHEWVCVGCFPTDPGSIELEGGDEKPVMMDMKFSVDRVDKIR